MENVGLVRWDTREALVRLVVDSLGTANSKLAYGGCLSRFMLWRERVGSPPINKALIYEFKAHLLDRRLAANTVNCYLTAIRKLASEAADAGLVDSQVANAIARVRGVRTAGRRNGHWLAEEEAQALLEAPPTDTLKGLRDRAILAVLLSSGLRRAEVSALEFQHIREVKGRWVIADLNGKGNHVRTVPIPLWCKEAIDVWAEAAGLDGDGVIFRPVRRGGLVVHKPLRPSSIRDIVREYAGPLGLPVSAHDLRRSMAQLALAGGAPLEQIQIIMGHADIKTTQLYLNIGQDFTDAPCDRLGIPI